VLWGRRAEWKKRGLERERPLLVWWSWRLTGVLLLPLSPLREKWEEKRKKVKPENLGGVWERFSGFNLEFW
jgi:hypothetical protein